jgi:hypothetical protein
MLLNATQELARQWYTLHQTTNHWSNQWQFMISS